MTVCSSRPVSRLVRCSSIFRRAFILEDKEFSIDYSNLDPELIDGKVKGFYELTGPVEINFSNGSLGIINCFSTGPYHVIMDFASDKIRAVVNELDGESIVKFTDSTEWKSFDSKILYSSSLTTQIVEDILNNGSCELTPYKESMELHLKTYEPLLEYINKKFDKNFQSYPFT